MGSVKVEDIDHLGIVAGVIQDLGYYRDDRLANHTR